MSEDLLNRLIIKLNNRKVIKPNGCWELDTLPITNGYSAISFEDKQYLAHRLSAAKFLGLDYEDKDKYACHKNICNNKRCWNPEHLYIGNAQTNQADAVNAGRRNKTKFPSCKVCGKPRSFKNTNVLCRICYNERARYNYSERKRIFGRGTK